MSARATRWLLFAAGALLLPLPFYLVETGAVPVARLLLLAGATGAVLVAEGPAGVVDIVVALLAVQIAAWLGVLWLAAGGAARALGGRSPRARAALALGVVAAGIAAASLVDVYRTPFRTEARRGSLGDLLD